MNNAVYQIRNYGTFMKKTSLFPIKGWLYLSHHAYKTKIGINNWNTIGTAAIELD